jgi:hypothetical protein
VRAHFSVREKQVERQNAKGKAAVDKNLGRSFNSFPWHCHLPFALCILTCSSVRVVWRNHAGIASFWFPLSDFDFAVSIHQPVSIFHSLQHKTRRAEISTKSGEGTSSSTNPSDRAWLAGTRSAVKKSCVAAVLPIKRVRR